MDRRAVLGALASSIGTGCLRFTEGGATPVGTPDVEYPTGLTATGVESILLDAHASALVDTSFASSLLKRHATTLQERMVDVRVGSNAIRATIEEDGTAEAFGMRSGSDMVWRQRHAGSWVYGRERDPLTQKRVLSGMTDRLRPIIAAGSFGRPKPRTDDNGNRYFHIVATDLDRRGGQALADRLGFDRVTDIDLRGDVSPQSILVTLAGDLTFHRSDEAILIHVEFETVEIGGTTVAQPGWAETARTRAPEIEAAIIADRRAIRFVHFGGDPVVPRATVVVNEYEGRGYTEQELDAPLRPGDRLVAYFTDDGLHLARDAVPDDADPARVTGADGYTALQLDPFHYFRAELNEL